MTGTILDGQSARMINVSSKREFAINPKMAIDQYGPMGNALSQITEKCFFQWTRNRKRAHNNQSKDSNLQKQKC